MHIYNFKSAKNRFFVQYDIFLDGHYMEHLFFTWLRYFPHIKVVVSYRFNFEESQDLGLPRVYPNPESSGLLRLPLPHQITNSNCIPRQSNKWTGPTGPSRYYTRSGYAISLIDSWWPLPRNGNKYLRCSLIGIAHVMRIVWARGSWLFVKGRYSFPPFF